MDTSPGAARDEQDVPHRQRDGAANAVLGNPYVPGADFSTNTVPQCTPYCLDFAALATPLETLNPNATLSKEPFLPRCQVKTRKDGVMQGWRPGCATSVETLVGRFASWDVRWSESEAHWENNVLACNTTEEVELLLPPKWVRTDVHGDVVEDPSKLKKVCMLCTASVSRVQFLASLKPTAMSPAMWRELHTLRARIASVVAILENSIGALDDAEEVMRDPRVMTECWGFIGKQDKDSIEKTLAPIASSRGGV
jgi:hypothetical protein